MTDHLPSKDQRFDFRVDGAMLKWDCLAGIGEREATSAEVIMWAEIERLQRELTETEDEARAANVRADQMAAELLTCLTGISTCSTCEACRGAARLALGGETSLEAEIGALLHPDWCPSCTKPYAECRCNGVAR